MTRLPAICNALECDMDYIFGKINTPKNCTTNVMQETGLSFQAGDLLLNKNSSYTKEVSKVLSRISKDGIQILYRPIAQETANKMFDSVTTAMYREDINNG